MHDVNMIKFTMGKHEKIQTTNAQSVFERATNGMFDQIIADRKASKAGAVIVAELHANRELAACVELAQHAIAHHQFRHYE